MNRTFVLKLLLTVVILCFMFYTFNINFNLIFSVFENYWFILLALIFPLFVNQIIVSSRWRMLLKVIDVKEKTWSLIKINASSAFVGLILPSSQGYDAVRIFKIEKKHPQNPGVGSTVIVERLIGLVCLCSIGLLASIFVSINSIRFLICSFSFAFLIILFLIFNKWCFQKINKALFSMNRLKKFFNFLAVLHAATYNFPFKKNLVTTVLLILLLQINNILIVWLLFNSTGAEIPFTFHLVAMPIINIISMIPLTVSGIGIRDGAFVYLYSFVGVPNETIIGVSILNYIIVSLLPALIGGVFYLIESYQNK